MHDSTTQPKKSGLGGNIDPAVKRRIQSLGGKAQPLEAKVRGGQKSRKTKKATPVTVTQADQ